MLLLLQGGAVFLPAAEAASIESAMARSAEKQTNDYKTAPYSQIFSSAGATVHVHNLAETATEGGQDGPLGVDRLVESLPPSSAPQITDGRFTSDASFARDAALNVALVGHGRGLQATVSDVGDLISKLADASVSRIIVAPGHYPLTAELSVTRAVTIEAAVPGSVVLDAQGSSSARRRVLNINPASASDAVELIGLNVTGGYRWAGGGVHVSGGTVTLNSCNIYSNTAHVRAHTLTFMKPPHRPVGVHALTDVPCVAPLCARSM